MNHLTRRDLGRAFTALTLAGTSQYSPAFSAGSVQPQPRAFPNDFIWGCATSAYQIEGAAQEDGRGPSIWDTFSHLPGKTHGGDTGDVAADSYHRYREDVALLSQLGAKAYRFSISWSRVFPRARGSVNRAGLAYYDRLVDKLLASGIQPWPTLFHWDLPQALADGWQSRDTAYAFADYAGFIARHLSDRVGQFMTTNELVCFTDLSYRVGQFAPGLKLSERQVCQVRHHGVLAHGLAVQAIRAHARGGVRVGLADNPTNFIPVIETPEHIDAARRAQREENAPFLTAVMEGRYTDDYLARLGPDAPTVHPGDMATIGSPVDFVGLNVYQPEYVAATDAPIGYRVIKKPASFPRAPSPWLFVGPEVMYWAVRHTSELFAPKAIYITENGCSASDERGSEGRIEDTDRIMFLRNYLVELHRATSEGYPVRGYFLWSLLDNFEWADGFENRFGIYHVDFASQARTPKLSASWYREVIAKNAVL